MRLQLSSAKNLSLHSVAFIQKRSSMTPETLAIVQNGRKTFNYTTTCFHFNLMTFGHDNKHF